MEKPGKFPFPTFTYIPAISTSALYFYYSYNLILKGMIKPRKSKRQDKTDGRMWGIGYFFICISKVNLELKECRKFVYELGRDCLLSSVLFTCCLMAS